MKVRKLFVCLAAFMLCLLASGTVVYALPSLDANNWDTLTVDERVGDKKNQTNITVIRDSDKPLVFYYVPSRPRLAETVYKDDAGKEIIRPVFQLMTLQTKSAKSGDIYEEGLLQFSLRTDLQPETASQAKGILFKKEKEETGRINQEIKQVKEDIASITKDLKELNKDKKANEKKIAKAELELKNLEDKLNVLNARVKVTSLDQIKLIALPVSSASISIYEPSGEWLSGGVRAPAIAPIFSTQAVPFQVNLTSLGADAMKALTQKGQGGLGVYYEMHFEGVLPPAKVTVEVFWEQTFSHFSENTKEKHYWNALLFAGGTKTVDKKKIAEDLLDSKCIKVTMEGREDELEALQEVLDGVLERINTELITKMAPPEKVNPAEAEKPSYGIGMFYGGGSSYAMVQKDLVKKGSEKFTFNRGKIVTRATSCGTFIGIGNYAPEVIADCNVVMEPGKWEKAYYTIPNVGDDDSLLQIDLNQYVVYKPAAKKGNGEMPRFPGTENPQLITWRPATAKTDAGWYDRNGKPVFNLSWPLQALFEESRKAKVDINDYVQYKVEITITSKGKKAAVDKIKFTKLVDMMAGTKPVTDPMELVDYLTVSADFLTLEKSEGLKKVTFKIDRKSEDGKKKLQTYSWDFTYKAIEDGQSSKSWFIPKEGEFQYIPTVKFIPHQKIDGKSVVDWAYNGKDLLSTEGYGSLEVDPSDDAWMKEVEIEEEEVVDEESSEENETDTTQEDEN